MSCKFLISELVEVLEGELIQGLETQTIEGVGTDSRSNLDNQLFVALKGEKFDAHDFVNEKLHAGAVLVHHKKSFNVPNDIPIIFVNNTLVALQKLAKEYRHRVKAKFLAISGSNGKTTTKEFAKSILSGQFSVTASRASFNNHWGVPLTLLEVSENDDVAIVEMGMNHLGELKKLSGIVEQDVSVVTNIGRAHMGEVGSFEKVIQAKKELYDYSPKALHIFNLDNKETRKIFEASQNQNILTFSRENQKAHVFLQVKEVQLGKILVEGIIDGEKGEAWVSIFGQHNVDNVMAASCLALACGMTGKEIFTSLSKIQGAWGRSELKKSQQGFQIVFDAYNANPESVSALIESVSALSFAGKKYFILGDMLELGDSSRDLHLDMIKKIANLYDGFWYIGQHTESIEAFLVEQKIEKKHFLSSTYEEVLAMKFHSMLNPEDLVLIKGSRGMHLESVLKAWSIQ